jgi:hypothetical protein
MIFTRENCKPIESPSEAQIARAISLTKSSFSALTSTDGAYVQAAGGPGLFFIEWRDITGRHHRGAQATPVVPFPDGTVLSFSAGSVELASNEWFLATQVNEILGAFLAGKPFPSWLRWSALSAGYTRAG